MCVRPCTFGLRRWLLLVNINCAVLARYVSTGHVFMTPFPPLDNAWVHAALAPSTVRVDFHLFMLLPWAFAIVGLLFEYRRGIRDKTLMVELAELMEGVAMFAVAIGGLVFAPLILVAAIILTLFTMLWEGCGCGFIYRRCRR